MRYVAVGVTAVLLAAPATATVSLDFRQLEFALVAIDGTPAPPMTASAWGSVRIVYTGPAVPQYLNMRVDGEWRVANLPLLAYDGVGTFTAASFDLGVPDGTRVTTLGDGFSVTAHPLEAPPPMTGIAAVGVQIVGGGGLGEETANPPTVKPPPPPKPGSEDGDRIIASAFHKNFPIQQCAFNACVSTAVSSSLQFLNMTRKLGIPETDIEPDDVARILGTPAPGNWDSLKDKWVHGRGWRVRARRVSNVEEVLKAVKPGQDVEIAVTTGAEPTGSENPGHVAPVIAVIRRADGTFWITVAEDTPTRGASPTATLTTSGRRRLSGCQLHRDASETGSITTRVLPTRSSNRSFRNRQAGHCFWPASASSAYACAFILSP